MSITNDSVCGTMTKTRRYQIASGWILTEEIPNDYYEWDTVKQNAFLSDHRTYDYEHLEPDSLWEEIEIIESLIRYVLKEVEDEQQ